jgi:4-aminobutyrate aminotransferase
VACAAALTTVDLLRTALMRNAAEVGAYMQDLLKGLMDKHRLIGDVRGRGLMIGVELVRDRVTKERAIEERSRVVEECFRRGLLVLGAGRNTIRLSPPLVLTKAQATTAVNIIDEVLGVVAGR